MRVGYFGARPSSAWLGLLPDTDELAEYHTVNNLLDALRTRAVDTLAIDPLGLDGPQWLPAVIETAGSQDIAVLLLTCHVHPVAHRLVAVAPGTTVLGCLAFQRSGGITVVLHHGRPVPLAPRALEILVVLAAAEGRVLTFAEMNRALDRSDGNPLRPEDLKARVFQIRRALGADHLVTSRSVGYAFHACPPPA